MINYVVRVYSKVFKKLSGKSVFKSNVHRSSKVEAGSSVFCSSIGRYSFCGYDCSLYYAEVGSFVSIAGNVVVGAPEHPISWVSSSPVFYNGRDSIKRKFSKFGLPNPAMTVVGSDVWIGHGAVILSGVTIGHGAVVGAGSIVTNDVPPYTIVAGSPARTIRRRFSADIVDRLLKSEWWNLSDNKLFFLSDSIMDPEIFLDRIESGEVQ